MAETFASKLFPRTPKLLRTEPLKALVIGAFVRGLSMRDGESLCEQAGLGKLSKSTASRMCDELKERFAAFQRAITKRLRKRLESFHVRGTRHKGIAVVLSTVTVAGFIASAASASGGPLRGRYYDGKPTSTAGGTSLALDFQASGTGRQVKHLYLKFASFTCPGGAAADLLLPGNKNAAITTGSKFTITLPSKDSFSPNPANGSVVLSGNFGGGGTATGKLVFAGSGPLAGCHKTIGWNGKVRPLVDHFAGQVTQGPGHASMSFYRTVEPHRRVTDFAVGVLTLTCPGGGTAHRSFKSVYSLPVHPSAKFGGDVFFINGEAGNIHGGFQSPTHAVGRVSYAGRDDCGYHDLIWSAYRVAAHVLGPLNFG